MRSQDVKATCNDSGLGYAYFAAQISLPNGAVIQKITIHGVKKRFHVGSVNGTVRLLRRNFYQNLAETMVSVELPYTTYGHPSETNISNPVIDNNNYSYFLHFRFITDVNGDSTDAYAELHGVTIEYTMNKVSQ